MRTTHTPMQPDRPPDPVEPEPDLAELQQRDQDGPAVPVRTAGPVEVHELPSRQAPAFSTTLADDNQHILGADRKRKVAILICDEPWLYAQQRSAPGVRWPADVPLVITHCDEVYAAIHPDAAGTGTLSVISEIWAD